jgi:4-alpha-glucanotransferase
VSATPDDRLLPDAWGIHAHWVDARGALVPVTNQTVEQLRTAMGTPPDDLEDSAPIVTRRGVDLGLGTLEVACEDGVRRTIDGPIPDDFPYGYHDIDAGPRPRRLIVSPGRCWLPDGCRAWGWTVQLYAARSRSGAGIGDLADLAAIREWAEGLGAGFLLVNPLHAVAPTLPQEASPYLPATRRFRNPIYLRVDGVEVDAQEQDPGALIDRDAVWQAKLAALEQTYAAGEISVAFEDWRRERGPGLESFATWCALAEHHGADWRDWPEELRRPDSDGVRRLSDDSEHIDRVRFHAWLQWLLDQQFRDAAGDLTVLQDLPIGVDGGGADAWAWQDTLVDAATVGAPPDIFNAQGQSWGSPPLAPWRLRAANYEPFVAAIRATMAGGGGLRIDHVMGLFRLWWIPKDRSPADGAYVRYPADDLLDIVALESHRNRSVVVGEDLGTVEPGVRESLAEHALLSYRLLWFEPEEPASWPGLAMGAITTHDLPTVAGLWTGSDLEDQAEHVPTPRAALERDRAALLGQLPSADESDGDGSEAVIAAAHQRLAEAPCVLLSATLEDAVGQAPRPNMPGTRDRPNWSIPLPVWVEDLPGHPLATRLANVLDNAVRRE